jgi:membrane protease subunit HflC
MSKNVIVSICTIIAIILLSTTLFFKVNEGNAAVILKLGELNQSKSGRIKIYKPGLHFKIPLLEQVKIYDMRLHTLTVDSSRVVTNEQKDVIIDAYLEWKISDISKFYRSVAGNDNKASILLKQFLEASLRAEVGKNNIQDLINNERSQLMNILTNVILEQSLKIGIDVVDVRIKQIDLPNTVTESIYQRMRSERNKVASAIRAEGERIAESIRAHADANVTISISQAEKNSKKIKAEADAKAAQIYTNSYAKSPEFYNFWRNMQAYQNIFIKKGNDTFILKPEGNFFKFFKEGPDLFKESSSNYIKEKNTVIF